MSLQPNEVTTDKIANNAVTTPKLADSAVTNTKLAANAVTGDKIADKAVNNAKIADGEVITSKLRDYCVTESKLAHECVNTGALAHGAVVDSRIKDAAVTETKIANQAVTIHKIADEAVISAKIARGAVRTDHIAPNAVTADKIPNASITQAKLAFIPPSVERPITPPVTTAEIADNAITVQKLSFTPLTRPINPGVATAEIADSAVTEVKIASNAVTAGKIASNAVTSSEIASNAVTAPKLASNAVTAPKLAAFGWPGTIPLGNIRFPNACAAIPPGDNDLYTCPANKQALVMGYLVYNFNISPATVFLEAKIGGVYYQLTSNIVVNPNASSASNSLPSFMLNAGETIAVNLAAGGAALVNAFFKVMEFDADTRVNSVRILNLTTGAPNPLYTVPTGKTAMVSSSTMIFSTGVEGVNVVNLSGMPVTYTVYLTPNGGAALIVAPPALISNLTRLSSPFQGGLNEGDAITIDATLSGGIAWVNVIEI